MPGKKKKEKKKREYICSIGEQHDPIGIPHPSSSQKLETDLGSYSESSVMEDSQEDHSESSSCSSPTYSLTDSPVMKQSPMKRGSGSSSGLFNERRRSEASDFSNSSHCASTSSLSCSSSGSTKYDNHRRSNPSIGLTSYPSQPSSLSASSSATSTPKKKTKLSFFSPNVLANQPSTPPPQSHPGLLTQFDFKNHDVATITRYLVCLYIRKERHEINCFFCAFSNFGVDKVALFLQLKTLFEEKCPKKDELSADGQPKKSSTRQAIAFLLKCWMSLSSALYDLQYQKLFQTVVEFVGNDSDAALNPLRLMLIKGKNNSQMDSELPLMQSITSGEIEGAKEIDKEKYFQPKLFSKGTVLEVANTLTFIMFRVFKAIGPAELHDGAWQGKNKASTGPHLHALSLIFNRIAFLCVVEILYAETEEGRAEALLKCIELAQTLERLNNFEGMAAVTSVFSAAPIQRLKPLWNSVGSKMAKKAKKLEDLLQPVKNYKAYHSVFNSREAPCLPWLAPKLRELRFMYDGNPKQTPAGKINYDFLLMLGRTIHDHLKFKDNEFSYKNEEGLPIKITNEDLVGVLEDVLTLDADYVEDHLYERSTAIYSKTK